MQSTPNQANAASEPSVQLPVTVAAELQDSLLTVMHDLQRLEGLLDHATENLLGRFGAADAALPEHLAGAGGELEALRQALRSAVTELQFHDMATQLIVHISRVLQGCAFRLANETMPDEDGEDAVPLDSILPEHPNPVTQSEMDAGSIELF